MIRMLYLRCKLFFSMLTAQEAEEPMLMMRAILNDRKKKRAYRFHIRKCKKKLKESIADGLPLFLYLYDESPCYVKPEDLKALFEREFPGYCFEINGYGILVSWSNNYQP